MIYFAGLFRHPLRFPLGMIVAGAPLTFAALALLLLDPVWIVLAVLVGSAIAFMAARQYLLASLPRVEGELRIGGLQHSVEVVRDSDGVPHVRALCPEDAYCALGFLHAQDRLWQMEYQRRVALGEVAEILGPRGIPLDVFMRTVGVRQAAEQTWISMA